MDRPGRGNLARASRGLILIVLITLAGATVTVAGAGTGAPTAKLGTSGQNSERIKSIPISKRAGQKPRSVISIPASEVGPIRSGDTIEANGEVEVSVTCLERVRQCHGTIYHYNPVIEGRFVLAQGAADSRGTKVKPISSWKRLTCSQKLPNRNHHCVLAIPRTSAAITDSGKLPCPPNRCRINLVLSAHKRQAKAGNVVVIGSDEDNGSIAQNKGMINSIVFRPSRPKPELTSTHGRVRASLPVDAHKGKKFVVASVRLPDLMAGEQLIVDAKAIGRIGHLRYNVLLQSQLVLSEKRDSTRRNGVPAKIAAHGANFSPQNGFNCTRGHSGHPDPCVIRKAGVIEVIRDAREKPLEDKGDRVPLFLNLVVAARAVYGQEQRPGDRVKLRRGGFIEVERLSPRYHP